MFYNPGRKSGHGNPYGSPQCHVEERTARRLAPEWAVVEKYLL
jgi:hypothetical protein